MKKQQYYLPTSIYFGNGTVDLAGSIAETYKPKKILLVTGKHSAKKYGFTDKVLEQLGNYKVELYARVESRPQVKNVEEAVESAKKKSIDLIIGLGGGSPLDAAKAAAVACTNKGSLMDFAKKKKTPGKQALPSIMIPTTAGTGSEVTPYIVMYDGKEKASFGL